jgi:hypothetical protein
LEIEFPEHCKQNSGPEAKGRVEYGRRGCRTLSKGFECAVWFEYPRRKVGDPSPSLDEPKIAPHKPRKFVCLDTGVDFEVLKQAVLKLDLVQTPGVFQQTKARNQNFGNVNITSVVISPELYKNPD